MTNNFPIQRVISLDDLDIYAKDLAINMNQEILATLHNNTLTAIKNAYQRGIRFTTFGWPFININVLRHLLRTSNSGAEQYMWQRGISGLVSPAKRYDIDGDIYISGSDFNALLDAQIRVSIGKQRRYLKYVRMLYESIVESTNVRELNDNFVEEIAKSRIQLKSQRITQYNIQYCEFSGRYFSSLSEVEFAHVQSVATAPFLASNIDNGVIILKDIHRELTSFNIHSFEDMYDYCESEGYSTIWADNYIY